MNIKPESCPFLSHPVLDFENLNSFKLLVYYGFKNKGGTYKTCILLSDSARHNWKLTDVLEIGAFLPHLLT